MLLSCPRLSAVSSAHPRTAQVSGFASRLISRIHRDKELDNVGMSRTDTLEPKAINMADAAAIFSGPDTNLENINDSL